MLAEPAVRTDRELVWILIAIAVVDVGAMTYFSQVHNRFGSLYFEIAIYLAAVTLQCIPLVRLRFSAGRPYSVAGLVWLLLAVFAFIMWNGVLWLIGVVTHWWTDGQPYAFAAGATLGLAPLAIAIARLGAKVRAADGAGKAVGRR